MLPVVQSVLCVCRSVSTARFEPHLSLIVAKCLFKYRSTASLPIAHLALDGGRYLIDLISSNVCKLTGHEAKLIEDLNILKYINLRLIFLKGGS